MINFQTLPVELSFMSWISADRRIEYRKSKHLVSEYESNLWKFDFGTAGGFAIDFNVKLDNGSLLTDSLNHTLLNIFKSWICIQTHYDVTGGILYADITAYNAVRRVITIIDYFLLNADHFKLSEYGLLYVTENDIIRLMVQLASSSDVSSSIYQWPQKLTTFIRETLQKADIHTLERVIEKNPFLGLDLPDLQDRYLELTEREVILARAYFWSNDFFRSNTKASDTASSYKYNLNSERLSTELFANTLRAANRKPVIPEFLLVPHGKYKKEFPAVSVRSKNDDFVTERTWSVYVRTIRSLGLLVDIQAPIPLDALKPTSSPSTVKLLTFHPQGRYKTLPYTIVLKALRDAIEFALSYGDDILESTAAVMHEAKLNNMACNAFSRKYYIRPLLTQKMIDLGVHVWDLPLNINSKKFIKNQGDYKNDGYHKRIRNNESLYALVCVFFGAVQICLGTLMARRQSELTDLESENALDEELKNLIFINRKSGIGELRSTEARPIPQVAVRLIGMIQKFHKKLISLGLADKNLRLLASPSISGKLNSLPWVSFNNNFDFFCDYFETEINSQGERYYIRQHQLRRFFAMMFFWGNAFGGMDTLRWFLGHTDIEHLYHYITESTPGHILRSSKAQFVTDLIKQSPDESEKLSKLVEKNFGTNNFSVLDNDELEEYIEDLMIENLLNIEPVFFEGPKGKAYRILIILSDKIEEA